MARNVHQYPHLARLHQEINTLFERLVESATGTSVDIWEPSVDLFQKGEVLYVRVDLPGVDGKDVSVVIRGNNLHIRGQKRPHRYPQNAVVCFHCMEITHGRFEKVIPLVNTVDSRNATAKLKDGVLSVRLPIIRDRRGSEIEVQVEGE